MISSSELQAIAESSKINITPSQQDVFLRSMQEIMELMDTIKSYTPAEINHRDSVNSSDLREDTVVNGLTESELAVNAHGLKNNCFTVPKVVQND